MTKPSMSCWFLLLIFLTGGCASAPKERIAVTPEREANFQSRTILLDAIDRKIIRLETLMKEKRIRLEDEALAVVIINAYQSAKTCLDESLQTPCDGVNRELIEGLSLIDERYFTLSGNTIEPLAARTPGSAPTPPGIRGDGQGPIIPSETLEAVGKPVKEGLVDDGSGLLPKNRESLPDGSQPATYEQTPDPIEQGEEQRLQERIELLAMKEQTLSHAKQLVEADKFEEAIAAIDALGVKGSVGEAAGALLDEAVSGIVIRERNRAAKAFFSAKQTDDPARREAYLRTSHEILKQLLYKYHSSSLISKIKSNLETVESEMAKVGLKP
jgi:hypothetical protein